MVDSRLTFKKLCDGDSLNESNVGELGVANDGFVNSLNAVTHLMSDDAKRLEERTLDEVRSNVDANTFCGETKDAILGDVYNRRFRLLANTQETGGPERYMVGVTYEEEIIVWGYNWDSIFQIGLGKNTSFVVTTIHNPLRNISKIKDIYAAAWTVYILYENGHLYGYGNNTYGQLCNGNTANVTDQPVFVGGETTQISVCAGGHHHKQLTLLRLKTGNRLKGCGGNSHGQLGLGSSQKKDAIPNGAEITIGGLADDENIIDISTKTTRVGLSVVLTNKGNIYTCGYNGDVGQCGVGSDASTIDVFTKVTFPAQAGKIVQFKVTSGTSNSSSSSASYLNNVWVLDTKGQIWGWGDGAYGQLGNGEKTRKNNSPVLMSTFPSSADLENDPIVEIVDTKSTWGTFMCLSKSGVLYGCGHNGFGELGDGGGSTSDPAGDDRATVRVIGTDFKKVWCGVPNRRSYCKSFFGVKHDGTLVAWGANFDGELGVGTYGVQNTKTPVLNLPDHVTIKQISAGGYDSESTTYILDSEGRVYASGTGEQGQLGGYATGRHMMFSEVFSDV